MVVVFLFGFVGFFVGVLVFAWFGLVSQLSHCFFACLRSFTDWCIAHRRPASKKKSSLFVEVCRLEKAHAAWARGSAD